MKMFRLKIFIVLICIVVLCISLFFVFNRRQTRRDTEYTVSETEDIGIVEEDGAAFFNNVIILIFNEDASHEEKESILTESGAEIDDMLGSIGIYRLIYDRGMSYEELTSLAEQFEANALIDEAYLDYVIEIEPIENYLD